MGVEKRRRVHLTGRTRPVEREGERQPAGLRTQLLLADIVAPAAAGLTDAAANHQEIDDPPVVHVHVVPVVQPGSEDDHRTAVRLFGIGGEFAGNRDDVVARHAGDLLRPGRRVGLVVIVGSGAAPVLEAAVEPVIGDEQIEDGRHQRLAVGEFDRLRGYGPQQHAVVVGAFEMVVLAVAEIGEADGGDLVMVLVEDEAQIERDVAALAVLGLEVPLALFAPAVADGPGRRDERLRLAVYGDRLPLGIVLLAKSALEIGGAQHAVGNVVPVLLDQPHQHRHVGVAAAIVLEILRLTIEMELAQDDVAHRHRQRGVGSLLGMQPQIGEFRGLGIVRRHDDGLRALVANLGVEMRVRRARLGHVRAPEHQEAGIVPVGRFRHVGLLAPRHRRCRRQVAVPVVERHAGAAEQ